MTSTNGQEDGDLVPEEEDAAIGALLRRGLPADPSADQAPDLLPAVQRKIRRRSRGKFFADGWSTSQESISYLLIACLMLVVIALSYLMLGPTGFGR